MGDVVVQRDVWAYTSKVTWAPCHTTLYLDLETLGRSTQLQSELEGDLLIWVTVSG